MAVVATPVKCTMQIEVNMFDTGKNKMVTKTRTYNKVKTDAGDEDILEVGEGLRGLQEHDGDRICKVVVSDLTNQD